LKTARFQSSLPGECRERFQPPAPKRRAHLEKAAQTIVGRGDRQTDVYTRNRGGERAQPIQRQLGHASIKLTVDTYGRWLPMGNKAAVNRLDDPSGSKVVAGTATSGESVLEMPKKNGEPWWDRTTDPLIKSQVLCQLS
jgi:hypothetical protein